MESTAQRGVGEPAEVERGIFSVELAVTVVAALATTLMLEATRVFLGYMVFVIDQERRGLIAATAFGVFAAFLVGGLAGKLLGAKGAVATTATILIAARLVLQFTENPEARLILGAIAVVGWGWMLPSLRAIRPDDAARGVVFGLLLDLSIRFLFGTVDLPWMPNAWRDFVTLLLMLGLIVAVFGVLFSKHVVLAGPAGPALIGVGPGLALFHLVTGNIGIVELKSDLPVQVAIWALAIGIGAGFAVQIRPPDPSSGRPAPSGWLVALVLTVFGMLSLLVFWRWNGLADLLAIVVAGVSAQLLVLSVRGRGNPGEPPDILRDGIWLTVGMLLHAVLIFVYYSATGLPLLIGVSFLLLGVGAALAAPRSGPMPAITSERYLPAMVVFSALVLALGLGVNRSTWSDVDRQDTLPADLTVVSYNIQTGFSRDNVWSLEQTARVIEEQQPDIVLLQEVSRGWIITSGADEARWLSHRLDMNLVWGPSSRDDLWGVVILTRGEVLSSDMRIYDTTQNLRRGVLGAAVKTESGAPLYVYNTHLDNPKGAGAVRLEQVTQLVAATEGATPAIVGGDFNATPDSDVIEVVLSAGFVDTGASLPPEATTSEHGQRIDYVFVRGPFQIRETLVPDVWASDHRPVVAKLTLAQQ
jgi:endonuclease/exonuclease/phosphatase family metal-dependent hydrolase